MAGNIITFIGLGGFILALSEVGVSGWTSPIVRTGSSYLSFLLLFLYG
ncbi:hypothetical protein RCG23_02695 [Neobacillus sp. PS3-34]|nr:hypothetical protein [Neobacillus sp. PS3-34]WML49032.1 hypothetical protein RCG23_02695 [Neobacillus sp. PS3-34]